MSEMSTSGTGRGNSSNFYSMHIMIKLFHRDEEYISMYPGEEMPYDYGMSQSIL